MTIRNAADIHLPGNWSQPVIECRREIEAAAAAAEDKRFEDAIEHLSKLADAAARARQDVWVAMQKERPTTVTTTGRPR